MNTIIEVGNLDGLVWLILAIMLGPAILLFIIGGILAANQKKKASKVFFILGGLYLLVSFGTCGAILIG